MTAPIATEKASLIFRPPITRARPSWVNPVIPVAIECVPRRPEPAGSQADRVG
jgi:hypothetical protein